VEDIRAFVAIELPGYIKQKLSEVQERLKTGRPPARWVAPESMHLTLKFLDSITQDTATAVTGVMEEAAIICEPFRLTLKGLGVFPNPRKVQVVWAGVGGDIAKLIDLQKELDKGLTRLGFTPDSRPFSAHLTLARMKDESSASEREAIGRLIEATPFEGGEFQVESFSLMRSQLRREGPLYTTLASVSLIK
jgi:RNA 2',3'-cyclic 3'-phosphodiesterase